jgi:phosphatidylserine decarboxylase
VRLAKWGWGELLIMFLAAGALSLTLSRLHPWAAAVPLPFLLVGVWFFRDPHRTIPSDPQAVVSPADGRVLDIEEVDEPAYIGGRALRVGIFLSPLNVHVNRAPLGGVVEFRHYRPGKFLAAYNKNAIEDNESLALGLVTDGGMRLLVKQITGVLARRIVCDADVGARLEKGQRYGMIKFGSRTELYLPIDADFELALKIGDRVAGGETVMGRLKP